MDQIVQIKVQHSNNDSNNNPIYINQYTGPSRLPEDTNQLDLVQLQQYQQDQNKQDGLDQSSALQKKNHKVKLATLDRQKSVVEGKQDQKGKTGKSSSSKVRCIKQGFGEYVCDDGSRYKGQWISYELNEDKQLRHGEGECVYEDGSKYVGQWSRDQKHGEGQQEYKDGSMYVGQWFNNLKHGYGYYYDKYPDQYQTSNQSAINQSTKYVGYFVKDEMQGEGRLLSYDDSGRYVFKGNFYKGLKQGRGQKKNIRRQVEKLEEAVWLYDQLQKEERSMNCFKLGARQLTDSMQQLEAWLQQYVLYQFLFQRVNQGGNNNYFLLNLTRRNKKNGWNIATMVSFFLYICYYIFGKTLRPFYLELCAPFQPLRTKYQVIKNEKDLECGGLKEGMLWDMYIAYIVLCCGPQILMISILISQNCGLFNQQINMSFKYDILKSEVEQIEYRQIYGKVDHDFDFEKVTLKQIKQYYGSHYNQNMMITSNDEQDDQDQLIHNRKNRLKYSQDGQKMKYILDKFDTSSESKYKKMDQIREDQLDQQFKYYVAFSDILKIITTARMDLDLLSDAMAVGTCYALSQSMNLSPDIRSDLYMYYCWALVFLMISLLPRYICWLYTILQFMCIRMRILQKVSGQSQDGFWQKNDQDEHQQLFQASIKFLQNEDMKEYTKEFKQIVGEQKYKLDEQDCCIKQFLFHAFRQVSAFYGLKYNKNLDYTVKSKGLFNDIARMGYMNREDMFSADQYNISQEVSDCLVYDVMERQVHSLLKMTIFRTVCENIPQLILQYSMDTALQRSSIQDCKKSNTAFKISITITIINMVIGVLNILYNGYKRISGGDLIVQQMKVQFKNYLEELKLKQTGNTITIEDHVEVEIWPSMIISLYNFLIQNSQYVEVKFGSRVKVRGKINDYLRLIKVMREKGSLAQRVNVYFKNQENETKEQILAELVLKKIFGEFLSLDSYTEYSCRTRWMLFSVQKKFIVKYGEFYLDEIQNNTKSWVQLLVLRKIEIWVDVENMPFLCQILVQHFRDVDYFQDLDKEENQKIKKFFQNVKQCCKQTDVNNQNRQGRAMMIMNNLMEQSVRMRLDTQIFDIKLFTSLVLLRDFIHYLGFKELKGQGIKDQQPEHQPIQNQELKQKIQSFISLVQNIKKYEEVKDEEVKEDGEVKEEGEGEVEKKVVSTKSIVEYMKSKYDLESKKLYSKSGGKRIINEVNAYGYYFKLY